MRIPRFILLAGMMIITVFQTIVSQVVNDKSFLSFDQLAGQLEKRHGIRFFYRPEWFQMKSINASVLDLPLNEALGILISETDYSVITIDSAYFVFVPLKPGSHEAIQKQASDEIVIGDILELGKYTRAHIKGKVLDGQSGKPLPGASVTIERLRIGVTADKNGDYSLPAPVGDHTLRVSFMGYDETIHKINLVGDGTLDLKLFEKSIRLGEVIVSARRPDSNVRGTQMGYTRLDSRSIKELPVSMGVKDVIKSITMLPGVQTVGEFGTGYNVRGGSSDQNLILLEDVPLFNSSHLFGLTSVVNSDGISSITLVKAGLSAQYGERASSLLDIRFGPADKDKTSVKGGIGLIDSRLYLETPLFNKKASLQLSGRRSYSDWLLQRIPDIDLMNSSAGFYDINAFLTTTIDNSNKISLFAYFSSDKFGFSENTTYSYSNLLASAKWKHTFSSMLSSDLSAGISRYKYNLAETDTTKPWLSLLVNSSVLYNCIRWNFSWIPGIGHSVNFGVNSILYTIMPGEQLPHGIGSEIIPLKLTREKANESALYVTDNFNLSPDLQVEIGIRYSLFTSLGPSTVYSFDPGSPRTRYTITDSILYRRNEPVSVYSGLEPRITVRYNLSDDRSLKLSYNRIHQYINLVSNTAVMTPWDVWKLSSPALRPLRCDHVSLGYFRNFRENSIESSVEVYYKWLKNTIDYKNGASVLLNPYIETELLNTRGRNYGIEMFVRKNTGKLTGWASYTFSRSLQRTSSLIEDEIINDNRSFPSAYDRPNNLLINLNYHISRRWRLGSIFTYSTGRPVTLPEFDFNYMNYKLLIYSDRNKYRLPDYHRLDVTLSFDESLKIRKKWKGSWILSVVNLYGRKNAYSVFYKKEEHMATYQYSLYDTYKLYIIGRPFPTLTYSFSF